MRSEIRDSASGSEQIPGVLRMKSGINSVSMAVGVMEKALYSSYTLDGPPAIYAVLFTSAIAIVPIVFFIISVLSFKNIKSYFIFPLLVYGHFIFFSCSVYLLAALIIWWLFFSKLKAPPNKSLQLDTSKAGAAE